MQCGAAEVGPTRDGLRARVAFVRRRTKFELALNQMRDGVGGGERERGAKSRAAHIIHPGGCASKVRSCLSYCESWRSCPACKKINQNEMARKYVTYGGTEELCP